MILKNQLLKLYKKCVGFIYSTNWSNVAFSQEGEDILLMRILDIKKKGFYVDVGAHHPKRFSNTYNLYLNGWNGLNIDPNPGTKKIFDKYRPRDVNLEMGVSKNNQYMQYYIFNETALNSFSPDLSIYRNNTKSDYHITEEKSILVQPLAKILKDNLPVKQKIDLMNIDVEGLDLEVLESNDWVNYRPRIIIIEILDTPVSHLQNSAIHKFLNKQNYALYSKLVQSAIFIDQSMQKEGT